MTYIGFDGVTTLAEDVENPRRNILLATVAVCLFTGLFGGLQAYLGQRVWPNWRTFPNLETAFMDICQRVGGVVLFQAMGALLIFSALGSALNCQLSAAKLLFAMGRDNVLPRRIFCHLDRRDTPTANICIIGLVAFIGALVLDYEKSGELINFGTFLSFMGVNFAVFWQFMVVGQRDRKRIIVVDAILPIIGFLFCAWIWWGLRIPAKVLGTVWFTAVFIYLAIRTHGFRKPPPMIDFGEL